jgi:hypothetical protein
VHAFQAVEHGYAPGELCPLQEGDGLEAWWREVEEGGSARLYGEDGLPRIGVCVCGRVGSMRLGAWRAAG